MRQRSLSSLLAALLLLGVAGCQGRPSAAAAAREPALVVYAAASLRDVFTALGREFELAHPGVAVRFNFAGTQELRTQLEHGAAADVFASADQQHMQELVRAARLASPLVFARNEPVMVVASEAAGVLRELADLPSASRVVVGSAEAPIGRYTLQLLDRAGPSLGADFRARVEAKVVSRELNVRQVLTKVRLGEAEAGIVYRSDARSAGDALSVVEIPADINVLAEYPLAVLTGAAQPRLARAWIDFVLSSESQRALSEAGFLSVHASGGAP